MINSRRIGFGEPVYVIAEMACAHHGSPEKARALITAAVESGADAIQLQLFSREYLMSPSHPAYGLLGKLQFSEQEWKDIYDFARRHDIEVFACTYDIPSAALAISLGVDGIKINSADLSNYELLGVVVESGIPFTLGTGASTVEEIASSLDFVKQKGGADCPVILMHGLQTFPTSINDANIHRVTLLRTLFRMPVGYQDHTDADTSLAKVIDLLAIGAGACMVEKHITLDRSLKETDYQAALEPGEFARYVQLVHDAATAMGRPTVGPLTEADFNYRKFQKKQIVAQRDILAGTALSKDDVVFLRTGSLDGFAPDQLSLLLGKPLKHKVKRGDTLKPELLVE